MTSVEELERQRIFIQEYRISEHGRLLSTGDPVLDVKEIDQPKLEEMRLLVRVYFRPSGQKGLQLGEVRPLFKTVMSQYPPRGYVYLAFLLEGFKLSKAKWPNPPLYCRFVNLKDFQERIKHLSGLGDYMLQYCKGFA